MSKQRELESSTHLLCARIFSFLWVIPAIVFDHHFNTSFLKLLIASARTILSLLVFSLVLIALGRFSENSARAKNGRFTLSPVVISAQAFIAGGISGVAAHIMLNALGGDTFTLLDRILQPAILAATWIPLIMIAILDISSIRRRNSDFRIEIAESAPIERGRPMLREILGTGHERWLRNIRHSLHALSYQSEWWILVLLIQGTLLSGVTGSIALVQEFELIFILGVGMSAILIAFQLISLPRGVLSLLLVPFQWVCTVAITYWLTSWFVTPGSPTRSQAAWDNRLVLTVAVAILCFSARMTLLYISSNLTEDYKNLESENSKRRGNRQVLKSELTTIKDLLEDMSVLPEHREAGVEFCHKTIEAEIKEIEKQWVGLILIEGKVHKNVKISSLKTLSLIGSLFQEAFSHAYRDRGANNIMYDVAAHDLCTLSIEIIDNGVGKIPSFEKPRVGMQIFSTASLAEFELVRDEVTSKNHFRITIPND